MEEKPTGKPTGDTRVPACKMAYMHLQCAHHITHTEQSIYTLHAHHVTTTLCAHRITRHFSCPCAQVMSHAYAPAHVVSHTWAPAACLSHLPQACWLAILSHTAAALMPPATHLPHVPLLPTTYHLPCHVASCRPPHGMHVNRHVACMLAVTWHACRPLHDAHACPLLGYLKLSFSPPLLFLHFSSSS